MSLGVFGYAGNPPAENALTDSSLDALLVLGSSLNQRDTLGWDAQLNPRLGILQVDRRPASLGRNFPVRWKAVGDAGAALRFLLQHPTVANRLLATAESRRKWAAEHLAAPRYFDLSTREAAGPPLYPALVIETLREALPKDAALLVDSGAHRAFAGHHFPALGPAKVFFGNGHRAHGLGNCCILRQNDWAAFAESLGVNGRRATTPEELASAFSEFCSGAGPMLVDAIVDREATTPIAAWTRATAHANIFQE